MVIWFSGLSLAAIVLLFFLSRKEETSETSKIAGVFEQMSRFLLKRPMIRKIWTRGSPHLFRQLQFIHPGEATDHLLYLHQVKKLTVSLMAAAVCSILALLLNISQQLDMQVLSDQGIARAKAGEAAREQELLLQIDGGKEHTMSVVIQARRMTEDELECLYGLFLQELTATMMGENEDLQAVSGNMNLVAQLPDYPFSVQWYVPDLLLMNSSGELTSEGMEALILQKAIPMTLTAYISYEDWEREQEFEICLRAASLSEEEELLQDIRREVLRMEEAERCQEDFLLPDTYAGKQLLWRKKESDNSLLLWMLGMGTAMAIFFLSDRDLETSAQERRKKLRQAYPEFVRKFVLYMGAGMTARGVFVKLAEETEHRQERKNGEIAPQRVLGEEILLACGEMRSGISEFQAYEHFGKRTGLQEYIRFAGLLQQNMKKGSADLLRRLLDEANQAQEEKYRNCRKIGEEATTKLLLPMVLMLLVVMVIVMMPAFFSMQM